MGEVELCGEGALVPLPAANREEVVLMEEGPGDSALQNEGWSVFFVSTGAIVGALVRWKIQQGVAGLDGSWTKWATLGINATGSCLLGAVVALVDQKTFVPPVGLCVGTGFCGAFTTFSTFAVDVVKSLSARDYAGGMALLLLTNALSLGGAALSYCVIAGCPTAT